MCISWNSSYEGGCSNAEGNSLGLLASSSWPIANAARLALGKEPLSMPTTTMMGALLEFISSASPKHFQPMPPNFGIIPQLPTKVKSKKERYGQYRDRSLTDLAIWKKSIATEAVVVN